MDVTTLIYRLLLNEFYCVSNLLIAQCQVSRSDVALITSQIVAFVTELSVIAINIHIDNINLYMYIIYRQVAIEFACYQIPHSNYYSIHYYK